MYLGSYHGTSLELADWHTKSGLSNLLTGPGSRMTIEALILLLQCDSCTCGTLMHHSSEIWDKLEDSGAKGG